MTRQQNQLDEIILSLHFLPDAKGNLKMIDKCWESFAVNFMQQDKEKIWQTYWKTIEKMVGKKWQFTKPIRVGKFFLTLERYCLIAKTTQNFTVT